MPDELALVFPAADLRGGVERVALDVATRLARTHTVSFIGESFEPSGPTDVRFREVASGPGRDFREAAAEELAREPVAVVLSFGVTCPPGDVLWVHSVHKSWLESGAGVRIKGVPVPAAARRLLPRHRRLLRLEKAYLTGHRPRAVLCTSQREADDLHRLYAVPTDVLHVVPNGFDSERFHPGVRPQHRTQQRADMGITPHEVSLLLVANELHRKGLGVLLAAVAAMADQRLRVDVVGRTPLDAYRGQIKRLGLQDRVHWHGGTDQVERAYAASDLLVLPTQYEPFGLVIIEALACGLPVITTGLAGAAAAVTPAVGRLQHDPLDDVELRQLLEQALAPGQLEAWSEAAPAAVEDYAWEAVLQVAEPLIFGSAVEEPSP